VQTGDAKITTKAQTPTKHDAQSIK